MSEVAIRAEGLGKQYRLGKRQASYKNLRESIMIAAASPFRRWGGRRADGEERWIWALKDVSFEIKAGEVVGVIGRNGAGKSTLLKVLSRITEPTEGEVRIKGRVGALLEVGTGFHPELTGRENIYLNGAILGMTRREIQSRFDEIVDFSEVEKFLDTPVKHYSTGMFMRLAFAVAAHLEPEILLVDEVLAVGDAQFQKKCLGKMSQISQRGLSVLFVSHNMNAVQELCSRVFCFEGGRLEDFGEDVVAGTRRYLFAAGSAAGCAEWVGADNGCGASPYFRPTRLAVCDASGGLMAMPLSNDDDTWVYIEGEIEQPDPSLTIGYAIFSEEGLLLFWSYQTDGPEESWPRLGAGRVTLRSRLPRRLLNEGRYRIELIASLHFRAWVQEPGRSAAAVFVSIQGGLSDSPLWMVRRPGLLAPVLDWEKVE